MLEPSPPIVPPTLKQFDIVHVAAAPANIPPPSPPILIEFDAVITLLETLISPEKAEKQLELVTEFVDVIKVLVEFNQSELSTDVDTLDADVIFIIWELLAPPIIEEFVNTLPKGGEFKEKSPLVPNKELSLIVSRPFAIPLLFPKPPRIHKSVKLEVPLEAVNTRLDVSIKTALLNVRSVPVLCKEADVIPFTHVLVVVPALAFVSCCSPIKDVLALDISIVVLLAVNSLPRIKEFEDVPKILTTVALPVMAVFNIQFDFPDPVLFKADPVMEVLDCIIELSVLVKETVPAYTEEFNFNNLFVSSQECALLVKSNPFLLPNIPVFTKGE